MDFQRTRQATTRPGDRGSAKTGVQAWWAERVTALALIPLTLWLVVCVISLHNADYARFTAWLRKPLPSLLMVLTLIMIFYHTSLGLQVIIEDYTHSAAKIPLLIATRLLCFALCVAGILATLSIALTR